MLPSFETHHIYVKLKSISIHLSVTNLFHDRHLIVPSLFGHNLNTNRLDINMIQLQGLKFFYSHGIQVLSSSNFRLWRQKLVNSSLLFRVAWLGLNNMWYFSSVHRLQTPEICENGLALPINFQSISYSSPLCLRSHMCKLNTVSCLYLLFFMALWWFPSLDLKVVEARPT